jgi:GDP/UDP-N,N'-diacetylbacillosamine 2-epimerase (hydrolysing)
MTLPMTAPAPQRRRKIAYLTGTRADFGLMRTTLAHIAAHPALELALVVTGTHLSHSHGWTRTDIEAAGLVIDHTIALDVQTRSATSMALAIADCLTGMARYLAQARPDVLMVLGDRGEMLAAAVAGLHAGVPVVHVHGGERSGTVDEPVRHAISKLSTHHLVATDESRARLIRMGEDAHRVVVVGAPGLDGLAQAGDVGREAIVHQWGPVFGQPYVLVVFHPVVQQQQHALRQTEVLIKAVNTLGLPVIWLEPNADAGALGVIEALNRHTLPAGSRRVVHLERGLFVQAMGHAAVLLGNSSAGIIEAATFGTPVVNVGDRQHGRERNANVRDVAVDPTAIADALAQSLSQGRLPRHNRFGDGQTAARIADWLSRVSLDPAMMDKCNAY